jgi:hypothetical protein
MITLGIIALSATRPASAYGPITDIRAHMAHMARLRKVPKASFMQREKKRTIPAVASKRLHPRPQYGRLAN